YSVESGARQDRHSVCHRRFRPRETNAVTAGTDTTSRSRKRPRPIQRFHQTMNGLDAALFAIAFLITVSIGFYSTVLVSSGRISNKLAWALAPAMGMGLCSILFFFFRRPLFTVELVLLAALLALWLRYRKQSGTVTAEHSIPVLAA